MTDLNPTVPTFQAGRFRSTEPVPAVVQAAFWILVAGSVLTGVELLVGEGLLAGVSDSVPVLGATLLVGLAGVSLRICIAVILRRGYSPARIYLTVVAVFSLGINVLNGADPLGLLLIATVAVPVVLVWLPAANRYYRVVTQARKQATAAGAKVGFLG